MIRLENCSLEELHSQLDDLEERVPTQRVLAAIGRKLGRSTGELATLHDVSEQTIRNWLNRFEEQPIERAPYDDSRSGRPPKLSDERKAEFIADLHKSPRVFGYDRRGWVPALAAHHLDDKFDVDYSLVHVRRLMRTAGVSWWRVRPQYDDTTPTGEATSRDDCG